jgi:hypothetical protein
MILINKAVLQTRIHELLSLLSVISLNNLHSIQMAPVLNTSITVRAWFSYCCLRFIVVKR